MIHEDESALLFSIIIVYVTSTLIRACGECFLMNRIRDRSSRTDSPTNETLIIHLCLPLVR